MEDSSHPTSRSRQVFCGSVRRPSPRTMRSRTPPRRQARRTASSERTRAGSSARPHGSARRVAAARIRRKRHRGQQQRFVDESAEPARKRRATGRAPVGPSKHHGLCRPAAGHDAGLAGAAGAGAAGTGAVAKGQPAREASPAYARPLRAWPAAAAASRQLALFARAAGSGTPRHFSPDLVLLVGRQRLQRLVSLARRVALLGRQPRPFLHLRLDPLLLVAADRRVALGEAEPLLLALGVEVVPVGCERRQDLALLFGQLVPRRRLERDLAVRGRRGRARATAGRRQ